MHRQLLEQLIRFGQDSIGTISYLLGSLFDDGDVHG
jgi:hypothetical protein